MGNSLKTLLQVGVIGTMVGVFGGENQDKKVDSTVDVSKSAISNLLSNEVYAATQINPVEFREAKEVSTTEDLINNIAEFNISEATFNKIKDIIKEGESNTRFISQIVTDDKTGASIEIYKTDDGKIGVEVQEVTINDKGESKPKGEPVNMEVGKGPLTISKGLVTMKTNSEGFITEISVGEASKGGEFTTIGCATPISKGMAMAIIAEFGAENLKVASSIGIKVGEKGKLMAVVNFVSAEGTYSVPFFEGGKSEIVDKTMDQVGVKVKYEQQVKSELIKKLKSYDVGLGVSKSNDDVMEEKTVDYNSEFYKVLKRGVEGATVVGATVGTTFELTKDVTVRLELNGDYVTWNITGDNETSVGVGGQFVIKDIAKENDRFSIDGKYSDLDRSTGVKYTYPFNDSVDFTVGLEQRFETKYDEKEETGITAGMIYHIPVYDVNGNKIVSKGSKNVIINGDASLTESVFNFAKQSLSDKVKARAFKHEELVKKPQIETPVAPTTPETPDTGLEDFNPRDKTLKVGDTYDTGLRNNKIKFTIEGNNGIVTENNGKIKGLKEGNVTVYVTDGKLTKHFKVYVKEISTEGPVANADEASTNKNTPLNGIDVLGNDTDDKGKPTLTGQISDQIGGTFTVDSGKVNFTPNSGFTGTASCKYEIKDSDNNKAWGPLKVKVGGGGPELPLPTSSFASSSVSKTVGDAPFTNAFTTNSSGTITYSSSNTAVATVNSTTGQVTVVGNGTATITANQAATASFKADTDTFSLNVGNSPELPLPTSSFASSSVSKTVGDGPFTNTFTTNSSGAITYSSSNTAVATVNSTTGQVTVVGNGTATITANQAATASFKADTDTFSLTVGSAPNNPPTGPALSDVSRGDNGGFAPISSISTSNGVSDLDGNTLTYSASGLPAGLSIDSSTGEITGTVDVPGPTDYSITVTVSDGNGGNLVRSFILTITNDG